MEIPKLEENLSYGRKPDGEYRYAILSKATPNKSNSVSVIKNIILEEELENPKFSKKAGFYDDEFDLILSTENKDLDIYYTLDGSEPTLESNIYTEPIKISSREGELNHLANIKTSESYSSILSKQGSEEVYKGTVVRARTCKDGVLSNDIVTNSYFINPNYTLPILSIVTDEDNFFGYENGIYVPGLVYGRWKSQNIDYNDKVGPVPTNYNKKGKEWEREAHIEFFETNGSKEIDQNVGIRISGGWSTKNICKSLVIYAREKYDEKDSINYDIFNGETKNKDNNEVLDKFKSLKLRNSWQDFNHTMFKDAFLQSLIDDIGVDTQGYRPVIVFINGEYWGIHNVRECLDEYYLENNYDIDSEDVTIVGINNT